MECNAIHALHAHLVGQKTLLYSDSSFTEYVYDYMYICTARHENEVKPKAVEEKRLIL